MERPMSEMLHNAAKRLSLHMPGAQGKAPFGAIDPYLLDATELAVTDDLYKPVGAIARAQELMAKSAGSAHTLLLTGGSTAGMHAMLLYAAAGGRRVILPRNVHISAIHLCAVAGIEPVFAPLAYTDAGMPYTPEESYLSAMDAAGDAAAMLIVRPDYYGTLYWPERAVQRAQERGMLVLCDEAHGAHLNWQRDVLNACELGADLCVQSAHKTLPALTAGAWLHASASVDAESLRRMLRMVQTSSPSFIIMLSLDDARAWMDENGEAAIKRLGEAVDAFYEAAGALGYTPVACPFERDRTRVVLEAPEGGFALERVLGALGADVEMSDERRVVCILSLMDGAERLSLLLEGLKEAARVREGASVENLPLPPRELPPRELPLSKATFDPNEEVPLENAAGRISAGQVGLYPPGVSLVTAGERITPELKNYLTRLPRERVFGLDAAGAVRCVQQ